MHSGVRIKGKLAIISPVLVNGFWLQAKRALIYTTRLYLVKDAVRLVYFEKSRRKCHHPNNCNNFGTRSWPSCALRGQVQGIPWMVDRFLSTYLPRDIGKGAERNMAWISMVCTARPSRYRMHDFLVSIGRYSVHRCIHGLVLAQLALVYE